MQNKYDDRQPTPPTTLPEAIPDPRHIAATDYPDVVSLQRRTQKQLFQQRMDYLDQIDQIEVQTPNKSSK